MRADAGELSDPATTSLALARMVVADPGSAPRAVATMLRARLVDPTWEETAGHVHTLRVGAGHVRLGRGWPFTATELSRAAALLELAAQLAMSATAPPAPGGGPRRRGGGPSRASSTPTPGCVPTWWAGCARGTPPDQVAGRLRYEHPGEQARWVSHEAIYTWIYALPKGELAREGILLRSGRTHRRARGRRSAPGARIVGMRSIDDRPTEVTGRQVPGHWEADIVIGKAGRSAMATLVGRTTRYTVPVACRPGAATPP